MKKKTKQNCSYASVIAIGVAVMLLITFALSMLVAAVLNTEKLTMVNLDIYAHVIRTAGVLLGFAVISRFDTGLRYIAGSAAVYIAVLLVASCLFWEGVGGNAPIGIGITAVGIILFCLLQKTSAKGKGPRSTKKRTG